jgi:hypothetical protein
MYGVTASILGADISSLGFFFHRLILFGRDLTDCAQLLRGMLQRLGQPNIRDPRLIQNAT